MPANQNTQWDGLGYSRHYAKRIPDIGKMFPRKMATQTMHKKEAGTRRPGKDNESQKLLLWDSASGAKPKTLVVQLANSPYMATLLKPNYKFVKTRASAPAVGGGGDAKYLDEIKVPSWRTGDTRSAYIIRMERWAKATAKKALTVSYYY